MESSTKDNPNGFLWTYYAYLMPILVWLTILGYCVAVQDDELSNIHWSVVLLLVPVANWLATFGILLEEDRFRGLLLVWGVAGLVIHFIRARWMEDVAKRTADKEDRKRHSENQSVILDQMCSLCDQSLGCFEQLPRSLMTTEELLDQADVDFQERAFAPFWDSVEKAATHLGYYDENVRRISCNAQTLKRTSPSYEGVAPAFPISLRSVQGIQAAKPLDERMRSIVRKAQRDFEFATIYEQRKTNQLLVAGFTNLAEALDGMGRRIASSIDDLRTQVSHINSSIDGMSTTVTQKLEGIQRTVTEHSGVAVERYNKALEMLDNIQRRRRPRPAGLGDGEY